MKYSLRVAQVRAFVQLAGLALAALPFQLLQRRHRRVAKDALKTQAAIFFPTRSGATGKRFTILDEGGGLQAGFELDHG